MGESPYKLHTVSILTPAFRGIVSVFPPLAPRSKAEKT